MAKTKKKTQKKDKKVQKAQESKAIQKTIINRELVYLYPEDCTDTLSRKAFRQKVRNKIRKMERDLRKMEQQGNEKKAKALVNKVQKYRKQVLADPNMEV